jgi:DNA-binding transcriptional MerR regulator
MKREYYLRKQVIELLECEEEFLEMLEAEELIRSETVEACGEPVFFPDQVERIRIINNLVRDLEVNLPGAEVILEMRMNMIRMQERFDRILEALADELRSRFGSG